MDKQNVGWRNGWCWSGFWILAQKLRKCGWLSVNLLWSPFSIWPWF
jgi:hypothetical protein